MRRAILTGATLLLTGASLLSACGNTGSKSQESTVKESATEKKESENTTESETEAEKAEKKTDNSLLPKELKDFPEASEEEVKNYMSDNDENTLLIDSRGEEYYSGWAEEGKTKGGHLSNALLFSSRWLDCYYTEETPRKMYLDRAMKDQGIDKDGSVIVYDRGGEEAKNVANYLALEGVKNIKIFHADKLLKDSDTISYQGYDHFLPVEIVKSVSDVKTGKAEKLSAAAEAVLGSDPSKIVLIDVAWGNMKESTYLSEGHVPGAIHINTDCYERPRVYVPEKRSDYAKEWRLLSIEEFRDSLCPQYGINKDSIVILTGDTAEAHGRLGFMLRTIGVKTYAMTGKLTAWRYAGYPLDKGEDSIVLPSAVDSFGSTDIPNPHEIIWTDEVKKILAGEEEGQIVDNRAEKQWNGEDSGYFYHDLAGRIENTIWCLENDVENGQYFMNADATPRTKEELVYYMKKNGVDPEKPAIFFCGDSWGAAKIAYWCQAVGLDQVKEWGNGWIPWSNLGNEFIDHKGRKVHYDKYLDAVLDENGKDVSDGVNILASKKKA